MTSKNAARRHSDDEVNPKIDSAPNSNPEKKPTTGSPARSDERIDTLKSKRDSRDASNQ
jgi:hypothetical protein